MFLQYSFTIGIHNHPLLHINPDDPPNHGILYNDRILCNFIFELKPAQPYHLRPSFDDLKSTSGDQFLREHVTSTNEYPCIQKSMCIPLFLLISRDVRLNTWQVPSELRQYLCSCGCMIQVASEGLMCNIYYTCIVLFSAHHSSRKSMQVLRLSYKVLKCNILVILDIHPCRIIK